MTLPSQIKEETEKHKQLDKRLEEVYNSALSKAVGVINRSKDIPSDIKDKLIKEIYK